MTQTIQYDKNPSGEGAAARVSRTGATPSLATDTFTGWPVFGARSHKIVATGTTVATVGLPNADRPAATPGEKWSAKVTVRNSAAGSRSISVSIVFYNTAGATLGTVTATFSDTRTVAAGAVQLFEVAGVTAPASTASVDVQVSRNAGGGAATSDPVHFGEVSLTKTAASFAYRDPGTNKLATWTGTADASTQIYWDPTITLTPAPANLPAPCITVLVDDLPPGVASLTLKRTAAGRTHKVRGAVQVPVVTGFSTQDIEAPFQTPCDYRAELLDSAGESIAFTGSSTATLNVAVCWVHNPLDPAGATAIDIADTSGKAITRPVAGEKYQPEQRTLAVFITGRRGGVEGAQMYFSTDDPTVAAKFEAMFGGYEDDEQQIPMLCIRATPFLDLPAPFFAMMLQPTLQPINVHMGGSLREWTASADEGAPPFAGIVVALLRRDDIDFAFATRTAMNAAYASRLAIDRDYAKAGTAP